MCTVVGGVRVFVKTGGVGFARALFRCSGFARSTVARFTSRRMGRQPRRPAGGWGSSLGRAAAGVLTAAGPGGGIMVII